MPKKKSNPHAQVRREHANETAEDYVEAIAEVLQEKGVCRVVDLAAKFAISHVTALRTISRLVEAGLVLTEPYKPLTLTPAGEKLAKAAQARHQVVFEFLLAIGVGDEIARLDSEGMEHHVSDETLACMAKLTARLNKK